VAAQKRCSALKKSCAFFYALSPHWEQKKRLDSCSFFYKDVGLAFLCVTMYMLTVFACSSASQCPRGREHPAPQPVGEERSDQSGRTGRHRHEGDGGLAAASVGRGPPEGLRRSPWQHGGGGATEVLPVSAGAGGPAHGTGLPAVWTAAAAPGLRPFCVAQ